MKFGDVDIRDLQMKRYPADSSAEAVVLCQYGECFIEYDKAESQWEFAFVHHARIKILTSAGYDHADVSVPYYVSGNDHEDVSSIKGFTYNLDKGKIVKDKLANSEIFDEETTENWSQRKFTMPNVREGSIIEYSYRITSDFLFNLRPWYFQEQIPVMWSEYRLTMPEYFHYQQINQGYIPLAINEKGSTTRVLSFSSADRSGGRTNTTKFQSSDLNYTENRWRWAAKDVPAFVNEPFLTTYLDYISKIEFELAAYRPPGGVARPYMSTWDEITSDLLKKENFGDEFRKRNFIRDATISIIGSEEDEMKKAELIYTHVSNRMNWDGRKRYGTSGNLKEAYEEKKGSSADVNFILILMLREAGLETYPVILSTRDHGHISEIYPIISKFNYVVAQVRIGEEKILLDATDKFRAMGWLPYRCLNGKGRLIAENGSRWVDLLNGERYRSLTNGVLALSDMGEVSGTLKTTLDGMNGVAARRKISNEGEDDYLEEFKKDHREWTVENFSIEHLDETNLPVEETLEFFFESTTAGNLIYFDPLIVGRIEKNPFNLEDRTYPVDYGCPQESGFIFQIQLPEGFQVDEKPDNLVLKTPDAGASYTYSVSQLGTMLQITSMLRIVKPVFYVEEYAYLRAFYDLIVSKQAEQIVLKRI